MGIKLAIPSHLHLHHHLPKKNLVSFSASHFFSMRLWITLKWRRHEMIPERTSFLPTKQWEDSFERNTVWEAWEVFKRLNERCCPTSNVPSRARKAWKRDEHIMSFSQTWHSYHSHRHDIHIMTSSRIQSQMHGKQLSETDSAIHSVKVIEWMCKRSHTDLTGRLSVNKL